MEGITGAVGACLGEKERRGLPSYPHELEKGLVLVVLLGLLLLFVLEEEEAEGGGPADEVGGIDKGRMLERLKLGEEGGGIALVVSKKLVSER